MKKISLKSVKSYLNRDEMRMVSGGSGGPSCIACNTGSDCHRFGKQNCVFLSFCATKICI